MILIGDIGGFNGSMVMIPTYFMSYISAIMYKWSVTSEIPVKKKNRRSQVDRNLRAGALSSNQVN